MNIFDLREMTSGICVFWTAVLPLTIVVGFIALLSCHRQTSGSLDHAEGQVPPADHVNLTSEADASRVGDGEDLRTLRKCCKTFLSGIRERRSKTRSVATVTSTGIDRELPKKEPKLETENITNVSSTSADVPIHNGLSLQWLNG
jgi:hypothetical protein